MTAPVNGLFGFKRDRLVQSRSPLEPALFGAYDLLALERWKLTTVDEQPSKLDSRKRRPIENSELGDYLSSKGKFDLNRQPTGGDFEGRLRLIFSVKQTATAPSLSMGLPDFELIERELNLHPSTLQYVRRAMKATRFWGPDGTTLSLFLSFPAIPLIKFNCISLSYDHSSKSTNALIGEIQDVQDGLQVEDFMIMLENCQAYLAHPLLVPVLLLDMLMFSLEGDILNNIASVERMETTISLLPSLGVDTRPLAERENVTSLLTNLHNTLKQAIKLLDAAHWMQSVAGMLLDAEQEIRNNEKLQDVKPGMDRERAEIKGFLQDLMRITGHLVPDPVMTQQRCRTQIEILNSKIAQEDNLLAAQMAVATTRDSSAMKALAFIAAFFLPGTYVATLFSMSMFDWQAGNVTSTDSNSNGTSSSPSGPPIVMPYIWIYWVSSVILTIVVIFGWRIWWLRQDGEFQKRLPKVVRSTALDERQLRHVGVTRVFSPKTFWRDVLSVDLERREPKKEMV